MSRRYFAGVFEAALAFILVASPLALGSVHPWAYKAVSSVIFAFAFFRAVSALSSGGLSYIPTALHYFIPLSAALALMQLVPLPAFIVEGLSPGRALLRQAAGISGGFDTLAVYPWATFGSAAYYLSVLLLFFLVVNHVRGISSISRIRYVALGAGLIVVVMLFIQKAVVLGESTLPFVNGNHLAGYLEVLMPVAAAHMAFVLPDHNGVVAGRKETLPSGINWHGDALAAAMFALVMLFGYSVALSHSRGGMLGMVFSLAVLGAIIGRRRKRALRFFAVTVLVLAAAFALASHDYIWKGMKSLVDFSEGGSTAVRVNVWRDSAEMVSEFPFAGVGTGGFETAYPYYKTIRRESHVFQPESDYLFVLAEAGLPGFSLAFAFMFMYARTLTRRLSLRRDLFVLGLLAGVLSALSALLLHGLVDTCLHMPAILLTLVILMGTAYSAAHRVFNAGGDGIPERVVRLEIKGRPFVSASVAACAAVALVMSVLMGVGAAADFFFTSALRQKERIMDASSVPPGEYLRLASLLDTATALEPFSSEYRFEEGRAYYLLASYTAALEAMGGDTDGLFGPDEYYGKALYAFRRAADNNPYSSFAHLMTGRVLEFGLGLPDEAEAQYLKAERLNPTNPSIKRFISDFYKRHGDGALAESYEAQLPHLDPRYNPVEVRSLLPDMEGFAAKSGAPVAWKADASVPAGLLEYRFRIWKAGASWVSDSGFGPLDSWTWDTAGLRPGSYIAVVQVRRAGYGDAGVRLSAGRPFLVTD